MTGGLDLPRLRDQLAEDLADDLATGLRPPVVSDDLPADRHLDRESSWLQFNERVLELAEDASVPLLERVRFLAIFAGNLDEYFMVRVAGLQRRVAAGLDALAAGGRTATQHLALVADRVHDLAPRHSRAFETVLPLLAAEGIEIVHWGQLSDNEIAAMATEFAERLYPILTPLAVDPAHPFPYISSLSLNLAVLVRDPARGTEHFARVKVPDGVPRFVPLGGQRFIPLEDVIDAHLAQLFPGMKVIESSTFRVTRNQDVVLDEDETENLLAALERELQQRRFGRPVRLELEDTASPHVRELLLRELAVDDESVYVVPGPLDLRGLFAIADVDRAELKYPLFIAATPERLLDEDGAVGDFFATLRGGDLIVHHPYDSFRATVQAFVAQAAADPNVLAIKATLYRTSGDSPIVEALIDAAEAGKQVLVVIEIKARFDEQANIQWARTLERAGCHVVYGMVGLKTHSKLCLVVRRESDGSLRRYAHVGTGNYNPKTARIYEDVGLFTAAEDVGNDLTQLFNHLSGYTRPSGFTTMLVAPDTLRPSLVAMIENEADHALAGHAAGITMKMNSLVDEEIVDALYRASRAGVPIELIIRGICSLRPGVVGLSETVRVRSILGRFLEHSRIFRFVNGGLPEMLIGSADLMHRNLDRRVEAVVRVRDVEARRRLDRVLDLSLSDNVAAWVLGPDGEWVRRTGTDESPLVDLQNELIATTRRSRTVLPSGRAHEGDRVEVPSAPSVPAARARRWWFAGRNGDGR
jgi:polyphosphate kinase